MLGRQIDRLLDYVISASSLVDSVRTRRLLPGDPWSTEIRWSLVWHSGLAVFCGPWQGGSRL